VKTKYLDIHVHVSRDILEIIVKQVCLFTLILIAKENIEY